MASFDEAIRSINISDVDNEISLMYKVMDAIYNIGYREVNGKGYISKTPTRSGAISVRYILVFPKSPDLPFSTAKEILRNSIFTTVGSFIESNIDNPLSIIYDVLKDNVTLQEIIPIYYDLSPDKKVALQNISDLMSSEGEKKEIQLSYIDLLRSSLEGKMASLFVNDLERYAEMKKVQEELIATPPLNNTTIKYETIYVRSNIEYRGNNASYGLELFDDSKVDGVVSYIQYNGERNVIFNDNYINHPEVKNPYKTVRYNNPVQTYYKIYNGTYKNTLYTGKNTPDTMYVTGPNKLSAVISLAGKYITFDAPEKEIESVKTSISTRIPINIEKLTETKVSGNFYVMDINLDSLFPLMLTIDKVASSYLYIEENDNTYADRTKISIHYKALVNNANERYTKAAVSISFKQYHAEDDLIIDGIRIPRGQYYIYVHISKAKSRALANQFKEIFSRILNLYKRKYRSYTNMYDRLIPMWRETDEEKIVMLGGISKENRSNIDLLKTALPDAFVAGYATRCQKTERQPLVIDPSERKKWEQDGHPVMDFPTDSPQIALVCANENFKYPYLLPNDLSNKEKYPYLPCCQKAETNVNEKGVRIKKQRRGRSQYGPTSDRPTDEGVSGFLPPSLEDILQKYNDDSEILRMGVPNTPNSFIHCLMQATQNSEYLSLRSADREGYVRRIRSEYALKNLAIIRQEVYDQDDDEIRRNIRDTNSYFDPLLYYRLLEESFNLNIFFIAFSSEERSTGQILVPRHKLFHIHHYDEKRNNVIILIHSGIGRTILTMPRCELVYDKTENVRVFGKSMGDIMIKLFSDTINNVTIIDKKVYNNYLAGLSYEKSRGSFKRQVIDRYGKCRGFFYKSDGFWIFVEPTYPYDLPTTEISDIKTFPAYERVIYELDAPIGVDRDVKGNVVGFNYNNNVYVPIQPVKLDTKLPQGPLNPLLTFGADLVDEYIRGRNFT